MPQPLGGSPLKLLRGARYGSPPPMACSSTFGPSSPRAYVTGQYSLSQTKVVVGGGGTSDSTSAHHLLSRTASSSAIMASAKALSVLHQKRCASTTTTTADSKQETPPQQRGRRPRRQPIDTRVVDILQRDSANVTLASSFVETAFKCERGARNVWDFCKGIHDTIRGSGEGHGKTGGNGGASKTATSTPSSSSTTANSTVQSRQHLDVTMDTIIGKNGAFEGLSTVKKIKVRDPSATIEEAPVDTFDLEPVEKLESTKRFVIKSLREGDDYMPLSTFHPAFHQFEASPQSVVHDANFWANKAPPRRSKQIPEEVAQAQSQYQIRARHLLRRRKFKQPLSTAHPVFGAPVHAMPHELFSGPVYISGFFLAVDPNFAFSARDVMNPNARLTVRDKDGNFSRPRYACYLESDTGFKLEAIIRLQIGWISPHAIFSELPTVIDLGKGFDISIPGLFQFTMVNILDETGCSTGSCLYLSGTPTMGFSLSFTNIARGRLVLNPTRNINPDHEKNHFYTSHRIHYRQFGFFFMKLFTWGFCVILALPMLDVPNKIRLHIRNRVPQPYNDGLLWVLGQPRCTDATSTNTVEDKQQVVEQDSVVAPVAETVAPAVLAVVTTVQPEAMTDMIEVEGVPTCMTEQEAAMVEGNSVILPNVGEDAVAACTSDSESDEVVACKTEQEAAVAEHVRDSVVTPVALVTAVEPEVMSMDSVEVEGVPTCMTEQEAAMFDLVLPSVVQEDVTVEVEAVCQTEQEAAVADHTDSAAVTPVAESDGPVCALAAAATVQPEAMTDMIEVEGVPTCMTEREAAMVEGNSVILPNVGEDAVAACTSEAESDEVVACKTEEEAAVAEHVRDSVVTPADESDVPVALATAIEPEAMPTGTVEVEGVPTCMTEQEAAMSSVEVDTVVPLCAAESEVPAVEEECAVTARTLPEGDADETTSLEPEERKEKADE